MSNEFPGGERGDGAIPMGTFSEVTKEVPLELLRKLVACARECAEDVIAEYDEKYPEEQRAQYPTYARRYIRDTASALTTLDLVVRFETDYL